jgi:hypothetical protein
MSSDNDESLSSDNETNEIDEENTEEVVELSNQIPEKSTEIPKSKRKVKRLVKSSCGKDVIIETTRKNKPAPIVVYLDELVGEEQAPQVIVKQKRTKGRPKKTKIVEYVDKDGLPLTKKTKECKQTIINHGDDKPLTDKELELIKLQERIVELEHVSGKTILSTKKGKIDKRSTKPPTEKQLAARKKFAEASKARHAKIKADKEAKKQSETKDSVKAVVSELQQIKAESLQKQKQDELQKQLIIEEEKTRLAKEKEQMNPYGDDIFN